MMALSRASFAWSWATWACNSLESITIVPSMSKFSAARATSSGVAVPVVPSGRVYPRVRIGYLRPSGRGVFGRPRISDQAGKAAAPTPPPTGGPAGRRAPVVPDNRPAGPLGVGPTPPPTGGPAGGRTAIVRDTGRPAL